MKYFIGIVPPEEIYDKLIHIQQQYGDNRLEPHITLRPPVTPLDEKSWLALVVRIAGSTLPFEVRLPGTGTFGKRVMFVSVVSRDLEVLHQTLIPALKIYESNEGERDYDGFHPHMTLGRAWCGFTPEDFINMKQHVDSYLVGKGITFMVSQLRIYYKPDPHGRYQAYKDVPLGSWR